MNDHTNARRASKLLALTFTATGLLASCGRNPAADTTWMLGTFSTGYIGCNTIDAVTRLEIDEGGAATIRIQSANGLEQEWTAYWDQTSAKRYRISADEDQANEMYYPIVAGTEWEVTRTGECDAQSYTRLDVDEINLESGDRYRLYKVTPAAFCAQLNPDQCAGYEYVVCEGESPHQPCD